MTSANSAPLILDRDIIERSVTTATALTAIRTALRALADGNVLQPNEIALRTSAGEVHVKGGHIQHGPHIVFKTATSFPGGGGRSINDGHTVVLDAHTGGLTALLLDRGLLTHLRTAAAAALAADLLSRRDAHNVALIGAGEQASFQLAALMEVRPIAQVRVWNRTARRAQDFAADTRWADVDVQAVRAVRDAVGEADIVVTATSSREPLVRPDWIRPGTHITAMGADFVGKQELDPAMFDRADVIVADDVTACRRVGELQHARDETARTTVSFANVVAGLVPGRASDSDITIIDQIGLGVYDAAIATAALEAVLARLTTAPLEPRGTDATNPQPRLR